jgi:hypothetical protein
MRSPLGRRAPFGGGSKLNFIRSYKRKRIPLTLTSASVVLAHAGGACSGRLRRVLHGLRPAEPLPRKALR